MEAVRLENFTETFLISLSRKVKNLLKEEQNNLQKKKQDYLSDHFQLMGNKVSFIKQIRWKRS